MNSDPRFWKNHIIALVIIAVAKAIIMTTTQEASWYVTFDQAAQMGSSGNHSSIQVGGGMKKDEAGHIVGLERTSDIMALVFGTTNF